MVDAAEAANLLLSVDRASTNLTIAFNRGRGTKTWEKAHRVAMAKAFTAMVGRRPTEDELDACIEAVGRLAEREKPSSRDDASSASEHRRKK